MDVYDWHVTQPPVLFLVSMLYSSVSPPLDDSVVVPERVLVHDAGVALVQPCAASRSDVGDQFHLVFGTWLFVRRTLLTEPHAIVGLAERPPRIERSWRRPAERCNAWAGVFSRLGGNDRLSDSGAGAPT